MILLLESKTMVSSLENQKVGPQGAFPQLHHFKTTTNSSPGKSLQKRFPKCYNLKVPTNRQKGKSSQRASHTYYQSIFQSFQYLDPESPRTWERCEKRHIHEITIKTQNWESGRGQSSRDPSEPGGQFCGQELSDWDITPQHNIQTIWNFFTSI